MIFGKNSQLGKTIKNKIFKKKLQKFNIKYLSKKECDLKNQNQVKICIKKFNPKIIINFASFNNVEEAEKNNDCFKVNSTAIKIINQICMKNNIFFVHFSTDYLFDGRRKQNYTERCKPNPLNNYGLSKFYGEKNIINSKNKNFLILRRSWLYSKYNNNFPKKIIYRLKLKKKIEVIKSEYGIPTSSIFVINNLIKILFMKKNQIKGIFHLCPNGNVSRYEFAKFIKNKHNIEGVICKKYSQNSFAKRPSKIVLSSKKLQNKLNISFLNWDKYYNREML